MNNKWVLDVVRETANIGNVTEPHVGLGGRIALQRQHAEPRRRAQQRLNQSGKENTGELREALRVACASACMSVHCDMCLRIAICKLCGCREGNVGVTYFQI